jgi:hypothetical protein
LHAADARERKLQMDVHRKRSDVTEAIPDSAPNRADAAYYDGSGDLSRADLIRCWKYGFFVRCCEEALPAGADLGND